MRSDGFAGYDKLQSGDYVDGRSTRTRFPGQLAVERATMRGGCRGREPVSHDSGVPRAGDHTDTCMTKRMNDEQVNRGQREFAHSLVAAIHEASPDGILVVDEAGMIASHNQRMFEIFGISPDEVAGFPDGDLVGAPDRVLLVPALERIQDPDEFLRRVEALYADPTLEDFCEVPLRDGRTLERHSKALQGACGRYIGRVWFFRDITQRKQLEHTLAELSLQDALTGIGNRRHFFRRMDREFARQRRTGNALSMIMLDIDYFKRINDRWGHATGDRVLREFAACVCALLRETDLFCRLGGEEFGILAADTDLDGAFALAERVRRGVRTQELMEGSDVIRYTVSAGVATVGPLDESAEDSLKRADHALYEAKRAGRDRVARETTTRAS